jgi:hypothetical protein
MGRPSRLRPGCAACTVGRRGASSTDRCGGWRSRRSTASPGEPDTSGRAAARMDRRCCDGARGVGELRRSFGDGDHQGSGSADAGQVSPLGEDRPHDAVRGLVQPGVCHPVHLLVAWEHVAHNKGARTAGIDGVTVRQIIQAGQIGAFLAGIASALKDGTYRPSPVRRVLIPKLGGKSRPLGIPTVTDRVVQQSLRMVLEPIFEADFLPVSYGFRPRRRARDAVAEIHYYASRGYRWVLDADIKGCLDASSHRSFG